MPPIQNPNSPNFFIIGAAKSGTTTLYHLLRQHPEIYLPKDKEPRFFNEDKYYSKGLDFYLSTYFSDSKNYSARGEASPQYLHNGNIAAKRIKEAFGDNLKFIVILRNPVERAWSHYLHMIRLNAETETFEMALEIEDERVKKGNLSWITYFKDGLYAEQLSVWFQFFPKDNFLILLTEDLKNNPQEVVQKIFRFLDVDERLSIDTSKKTNVAATIRHKWLGTLFNRPNMLTNTLKHIFPYTLRKIIRDKLNEWNKQPLTERTEIGKEIAEDLRKKYHDDIVQLETILNRDLSHWKNSG